MQKRSKNFSRKNKREEEIDRKYFSNQVSSPFYSHYSTLYRENFIEVSRLLKCTPLECKYTWQWQCKN